MSLEELQQKLDMLQHTVADLNELISESKTRIDDLHDEIGETVTKIAEIKRQQEWERVQAEGRKWKEEHPEEHAAFLAKIRARNQTDLASLANQFGWDLNEAGTAPLSPWMVFKVSDFAEVNNPLMAHVMAKAGVFPSVGIARKNGFSGPLSVGEWIVTKKKIRIKVVDE